MEFDTFIIMTGVQWGEDLYYWDKKNVQFNTSGIGKWFIYLFVWVISLYSLHSFFFFSIEFSHRFMGTGEGTKEMPDHLLEDLRKRTIYYKTSTPDEIKVKINSRIGFMTFYHMYLDYCLFFAAGLPLSFA